ncbi:hypothetical protein ANCCEY_11861 [Ancylostoma ceylanicum]|uniref:SCP domain-containing protein n=2 Tax=Ancylostoma ceylanicum TaxID=53326 RepID=A0A0D6LAZ2_9BILA|nr:hypothetical protein ANCCEY_11861 [Ancylostoma ceylanicum]
MLFHIDLGGMVLFNTSTEVFLLPVASSQTQAQVPMICPNSPFEKEYIDDYVVGKINDERYALLAGLTLNGPWQGRDKWTPETQGYGKKLPKGKTMNNLVYSCELEKEADAALNHTCSYNEPNAPAGKTGIFYSMDIDWDVPEMMSAAWAWMEEIEHFAVSDHAISDKAVTFHDLAIRQYLNLMRSNITKIGCAEALCKENGLNKYRAYCLIDQPPLKIGDIIYEAGSGGCDKGEHCPQGTKCGQFGMCDVQP